MNRDALPAVGFFVHLFPIGHGQADLRENFLMSDGLVVLEPFIRLGDRHPFCVAQPVTLLGQMMGVLFISGHGVQP